MSQPLSQAAIDEAIALGIDLQFDDLYNPDEIALIIKQREEALSIQADEEYANMLQLQEHEEFVKSLHAMEENPPNNSQHDVPSTSGGSSLPNQTATTENNNPENEIEDVISGLPTQKYRRKTWWRRRSFVPDTNECSLCAVGYEKGDKITMLPCKHAFHKDCVSNWLKENKVCCECQAEVNP
ncbi:PREDICTED: E3 ubiquitin ligase BIG BROTHER-related-like [Camelina sativa]|uniref:E3 ubiquitin ligase BIG BROTHER-related-like n=1 Tax=Camelina sativa TaxID=90675 RepID=A0ABM0X981_CAMSA|nr:PREDICTED: E3 ubiquitin ligase BIG BROTHER-related-like [Camelina sativa]